MFPTYIFYAQATYRHRHHRNIDRYSEREEAEENGAEGMKWDYSTIISIIVLSVPCFALSMCVFWNDLAFKESAQL